MSFRDLAAPQLSLLIRHWHDLRLRREASGTSICPRMTTSQCQIWTALRNRLLLLFISLPRRRRFLRSRAGEAMHYA